MERDPSFEHVIFSMTLSVQFSSYVQHIGNTTFPCSHHASTTFSYFPFRDKFSHCLWVNIFFRWRFSFWLKITLKKIHVGFSFIPNSDLAPRSTFRTFSIQKYIRPQFFFDNKDVLSNAKISIFWQNESKIRIFQQNKFWAKREKKWQQISNEKIGRF